MSLTDPNDEQEDVIDDKYMNYSTDLDTTCTICQAEFLDAEDLAIHLQQIHKVSAFAAKQCQFCISTYPDLITYAEHLRDKHIINLKYCQYCLRAFQDYDAHRLHEKKHRYNSHKSYYNCTQCENRFGNICELKNHDREYHKNDFDGVMIQEIFPYLSAVLNVKASTLMQSLNTDTVYICVGCEYSTADVKCFINHAKSRKCISFVCDKCSNVYKTKFNLRRHMAVKDCSLVLSKTKTKTCPECHVTFNKYMYQKHKRNCKVIKCFTCDQQFGSMYELSEHQSKQHPLSVELKACTFCWKQCVGSVALQKHIDRSHKPELHLYKYQCIYCKSVYKHPQKLFGHFFSKHKEIEPYTCKICDKKFRIRKKFTLHIKLDHKSVGFVEFDENYHVLFVDKKSENPFVPKSLFADQIEDIQKGNNSEKPEDSSNLGLLNMNSEMSVTETEGNQTEVESAPKPRLRRKRTGKTIKKQTEDPITVESSDDEPLLVIKKRVQKSMPKILRNRWTKKQLTSINKQRFTCNICKKYCYTYQNYNHHISLHSNKDYKKCIKCSKVFRSKEKLNKHIATDHTTSRLTETLKNLLQKRKNGQSIHDDLPMSEKFRRTIKKVICDTTPTTATITTVENGLSVKNFIENFIPEVKPEAVIDNAVSLKLVTGTPKEPTIKMTKFEPKPISNTQRLAMPVKFKDCYMEKCVAKIRLVQPSHNETYIDNSNDHDYNNYEDAVPDMDRNEAIPEVAEEVMLEGTEETPKVVQIPHKIVIPKLPTEYKDIRIAHLLPQAPYYKIVKVNEVLNMQNLDNNSQKEEISKVEAIKLPDGTKLVNTNPLAHLLGKTPIEKLMEPIKNKYYKPKPRNFQGMLAEALSNLDKPPVKRKKKGTEVAATAEIPTSATS